jgi:hypothetical protein
MRTVLGWMKKESYYIARLQCGSGPALILHKADMPRLGYPILDFTVFILHIEGHRRVGIR